MATFLRCFFGPQLLRLNFRNGLVTDYQPVAAENIGNTIITSVSCAARILVYASPIVLPFALRQGWISLNLQESSSIPKFVTGLGLLVVGALFLRALGRITNPAYRQFISILSNAKRDYTVSSKKEVSQYDFEFSAWPVDWDSRLEGDQSKPHSISLSHSTNHSVTQLPVDMLAWLLTHTFGISLVYPGSMSLMKMLVEKPLLEGRSKLYLEHGGQRSKVMTRDGNYIDTMYVDQRNKPNGSTLVLCCEGNAGFYEIGIMATPISCGYSVLGWNHPGFYGSSGTPYPSQETNAADAVMQFAINKLGYKVENIVLLGWSIGGYSSTWLAMNYPDVRGLVLDATFDDLLPLALPRMPQSMSSIVTTAVRKFIHLNVGEQLSKFHGPVLMIRRANDEMICTVDGELWSNRGNNLLISYLTQKFPGLVSNSSLDSLTSLLYTPGGLDLYQDTEMGDRFSRFIRDRGISNLEVLGQEFSEEDKGRMLCFLATKFMIDLNTTHCTPLPPHKFQLPTDFTTESEFVTISKAEHEDESKDELIS